MGAGTASTDHGAENDMDALKAHPFFEGINFATLLMEKAPVAEQSYSPVK